MPARDEAVPVNVLTGFLGSGKTTLLRYLLASPDFADAAILINELGEVGLDHLVLQRIDTSMVLLESGCVCCTIRDDLRNALRALHSRRERGSIPRFRRVVIETTGLADPTPILATLMADPIIPRHFRVGNVVTTVDAVHGLAGLDRHPELWKQVAIADRLVVTKVDLVPTDSVALLVARLQRVNPTAIILQVVNGSADAALILGQDVFNPATKAAEVQAWLAHDLQHAGEDHGHRHELEDRHRQEIRALMIEVDEPVEWSAFGLWLSLMASRHGERLLRVKAILNVEGSRTPVLVNGVQRLVHPPEHLAEWPTRDRRSRLIIVGEGLVARHVEWSLQTFLKLGRRVRDPSDGAEPVGAPK